MPLNKIIIIRHGEKPKDDTAIGLSNHGRRRAAALVAYLPVEFQPIDYIFATKPSKASTRPLDTVVPLALSMNTKINTEFEDAEVKEFAEHVLTTSEYAGKTLLVCWHHGKIVDLVKYLGGQPPTEKWADDVFDRIWVIDYTGEASPSAPNVRDIAMRLMFGDSEK